MLLKTMGAAVLGNILATPMLINWIIKTTVQAVDPLLPEGFVTVGSFVQFKHTAPTVVGATVRITATVREIVLKWL
jgi:predicted thioesterase